MLYKKSLAACSAIALLLSLAALPAAAAPLDSGAESPETLTILWSWLADAMNLDLSFEDKVQPADQADPNQPDRDREEPLLLTSDNDPPQDPGDELGTFPEPGG